MKFINKLLRFNRSRKSNAAFGGYLNIFIAQSNNVDFANSPCRHFILVSYTQFMIFVMTLQFRTNETKRVLLKYDNSDPISFTTCYFSYYRTTDATKIELFWFETHSSYSYKTLIVYKISRLHGCVNDTQLCYPLHHHSNMNN